MTGGAMKNLCDALVNIPVADTPRVQEVHILVGHIVCEIAEKALCPSVS
jgi:D-sedoheptulose 7-phosphate isomerase